MASELDHDIVVLIIPSHVHLGNLMFAFKAGWARDFAGMFEELLNDFLSSFFLEINYRHVWIRYDLKSLVHEMVF